MKMLELLLQQYKEMFGEDFPLADFAGKPEIEVINIIYDCTVTAQPYDPARPTKSRIDTAPGVNENR